MDMSSEMSPSIRSSETWNNLNIPFSSDSGSFSSGLGFLIHLIAPVALGYVYLRGKKEAEDVRKEYIHALTMEQNVQQQTSGNVPHDVANLKQEAAHLKQEAAHLKQEAAHLKQEAAHLKQEVARLKQEATQLKQEATHFVHFKQDIKNTIQEEEEKANKTLKELEQVEFAIKHILHIKCSPLRSREDRDKLEKDLMKKSLDPELNHLNIYDGLTHIYKYDHAHCGGGFNNNGQLYRVWMQHWKSLIHAEKERKIADRVKNLI